MTVSVGQIGTFAYTSASTGPFSFATLPSAGSRIVLPEINVGATSGTGTASDNQGVGNTYSSQLNSIISAAGLVCGLDCPSIGTPSGTFTVTGAGITGGAYMGALIEAKGTTGVAAGTPVATGGATSASFAASLTAGAASTVPDSLVIAWLGFYSNGAAPNWNTPTGFTNALVNTAGGTPYRIDYKILTATETTTANWGSALTNQGLAGTWFAGIIVYSGTAAGNTASIAWVG